MKTKIGNVKTGPDETVFPQLRKGKLSGNIYLFLTKTSSVCLTRQDNYLAQDDLLVGVTSYFTGSITLSND